MDVVLKPYELLLAGLAGEMRQIENIKKARAAGNSYDGAADHQIHIEGCCAEMAVAKALNVYWSGKGDFRAPDVGAVDVRQTTHEKGRLILHPSDPDDRRFYLVIGKNGEYRVAGWIMGRDGKQQKFWADPVGGRPAFFVPQDALENQI